MACPPRQQLYEALEQAEVLHIDNLPNIPLDMGLEVVGKKEDFPDLPSECYRISEAKFGGGLPDGKQGTVGAGKVRANPATK